MAKKQTPVSPTQEKKGNRIQVAISEELIRKMDHICAETKESRPHLVDRLLGPALNVEWEKVKREMGL
jgi:metal-responsive CopG/Arc/MetJ family transcriptional regulator